MHDKTQVMPLSTDDNIHTRLTHSLEVSIIGESLALHLVTNQDFIDWTGLPAIDLHRTVLPIVRSACLVHDIGNPPFGHFGEESIGSYFQDFFKSDRGKALGLSEIEKEDFIHFDGNAQGFRILTKLQILDDLYGLNLTHATLGAFLKYPNAGEVNKSALRQKKRGVFQSEKDYLNQVAHECGLRRGDTVIRHPLAYLVEAADSICYRVMDIEDGFNKGWYSFEDIRLFFSHSGSQLLADLACEVDAPGKSKAGKIVALRLRLINILVAIAVDNFIKNYDDICRGKYNKELVQDDPGNVDEVLSQFCKKNVFPQREILSLELTGDTVIKGLLDRYIDYILRGTGSYSRKAERMISKSIMKAAKLETGLADGTIDDLPNYYKLRVIVDFVSGMTDQYALSHFQMLHGQRKI